MANGRMRGTYRRVRTVYRESSKSKKKVMWLTVALGAGVAAFLYFKSKGKIIVTK